MCSSTYVASWCAIAGAFCFLAGLIFAAWTNQDD
jgi:hypothetical protein